MGHCPVALWHVQEGLCHAYPTATEVAVSKSRRNITGIALSFLHAPARQQLRRIRSFLQLKVARSYKDKAGQQKVAGIPAT